MEKAPHPTLTTPRVLLRPWRDEDVAPFAAMNADPEVMAHFPRTATYEETAASVGRVRAHFDAHGFGMWAVEVPGVAPFIGFVGIQVPRFMPPCGPCIEIGWRLARPWWGHGYVTEAAGAALDFGFDHKGLEEIVAFTVPANRRSRAVMERLGMTWNPEEDFDHPDVPEGSPVKRHVLYRLRRAGWHARRAER